MELLTLGHAAVTLILVGLIWTVQVVHYPLFRLAAGDDFGALHAAHAVRIAFLVGVLMPIEALLALGLAFLSGTALTWAGILLLGVIWLSTALVQVPLHRRLAHGFDREVHRRLVGTNWTRTLAWTLRGAIALALLA